MDPTIQALHDYWCSLREGLPPRRKAFEFMDIYKLAPNLLLSERVAPATFRFAYCGTTVADNLPRDLTGLVFAPQTARVTAVDFAQLYMEILGTPCWRFTRYAVDWPNAEYGSYLLGAGPLADEDGTLKYVLSCAVFQEKSPFAPRV